MSKVSNKFITMCYENYACPNMKEFVFSCKGRPFAMLSSHQQIPVPTLSLIDFNLVQDLGMKMFDIQCSKYTFAGSKLRILGKINQTVQCVKNGKLTGNLHIKANVVEDTLTHTALPGSRWPSFYPQKLIALMTKRSRPLLLHDHLLHLLLPLHLLDFPPRQASPQSRSTPPAPRPESKLSVTSRQFLSTSRRRAT